MSWVFDSTAYAESPSTGTPEAFSFWCWVRIDVGASRGGADATIIRENSARVIMWFENATSYDDIVLTRSGTTGNINCDLSANGVTHDDKWLFFGVAFSAGSTLARFVLGTENTECFEATVSDTISGTPFTAAGVKRIAGDSNDATKDLVGDVHSCGFHTAALSLAQFEAARTSFDQATSADWVFNLNDEVTPFSETAISGSGTLTGTNPTYTVEGPYTYAPSTNASDSDGTWDNPTNAYEAGGSFANPASIADAWRWGGFGISAPSAIAGLEVTVRALDRSADGGDRVDVYLSWDGGTSRTSAKRIPATGEFTGSYVDYVVGGPTDTWGRSWSASELADGNFTVILDYVPLPGNSGDTAVDVLSATIYASVAAPPTVIPITLRNPGTGIKIQLSDVTGIFQGILQATETDTPFSVTRKKTKTIGQVTEGDLAQAVGKSKRRSLTQTVETDLSQPVTWLIRKLVGQTNELNLAQSGTSRKSRAIGLNTEVDLAQVLTRVKRVALTQASESDVTQTLTSRKGRLVGLNLETDLAQSPTSRKRKLSEQSTETDLTQGLTGSKLLGLDQVQETDTPQVASARKSLSVGQLTEADLAQGVAPFKLRLLLQAQESDTSQAGDWLVRRLVLGTLESDSSQTVGAYKTIPVGQGTETDEAQVTLSQGEQVIAAGLATEFDVSGVTLWAPKIRLISQTTEVDVAQSFLTAKTRSLSSTTESDTSSATTGTKFKDISQTEEFDFAQGTAPTKVLTVAQVEDSELAHIVGRQIAVAQVVEFDAPQSTTVKVGTFITQTVELHTALGVIPTKLIAAATAEEVDEALALPRSVPIGVATETDRARSTIKLVTALLVPVAVLLSDDPQATTEASGYPVVALSSNVRQGRLFKVVEPRVTFQVKNAQGEVK